MKLKARINPELAITCDVASLSIYVSAYSFDLIQSGSRMDAAWQLQLSFVM